MIELEIEHEQRPRHRLEVKQRGHLDNIREGPYITHNVLVTHADFLKSTNNDKEPKLYRIFPTGGRYNYIGDIFALVTWYFIIVFIVTSILLACYCDNKIVNIVNAIVLCIIMMYHIIALYGVTKNRKKFRRAWFIAEAGVVSRVLTTMGHHTLCYLVLYQYCKLARHQLDLKYIILSQTSAEKYMGLQNYFVDVTLENTLDLHFIDKNKKQKIITNLSKKQVKSMVLMLCTKSYWRNRIIDPAICLTSTAVICLISIFVQIITLR